MIVLRAGSRCVQLMLYESHLLNIGVLFTKIYMSAGKVVDESERVLLDAKVRVPNLVSPLTAVTGMTREHIAAGISLEDALAQVHLHRGPNINLVGQAIQNDIQWLGLRKGIDYGEAIDIAKSFRVYNPRYNDYSHFSLREEVFGLLGIRMSERYHSPVEDAKMSIRMYKDHAKCPTKARQAKERLQQMRLAKMFPPKDPFLGNIDGVCGFKFNRKKCFCGQPTA
eukprot:gene458-837_t